MKPIKVTFSDFGRHNGMGEPDPNGSYTAFEVVENGDRADMPQRLVFMAPTHQFVEGGRGVSWQPIETAPKDGTPIIGAWKDGKWHARQMRWNDMWDDAWVDDMADCICHPTHWCYPPDTERTRNDTD